MGNLWRLVLNPQYPEGLVQEEVVSFCIEEGILGIGWQVPENGARGLCGDDYLEYVQNWFPGENINSVRAFMRIRKNDLIWTQDAQGSYLLGLVSSDPQPQWNDVFLQAQGLFHVVKAHIIGGRSGIEINDTQVPDRITNVRGFLPACQRIADPYVWAYSCWLFTYKIWGDL